MSLRWLLAGIPLLLASAALPAQGAPAGAPREGSAPVAIFTREAVPTERAIVAALRTLLGPDVEVVGSEPEHLARARLAALDGRDGATLIVLGRERARIALERTSACRLVCGGDLGDDAAELAKAVTSRPAGGAVFSCRPAQDEVANAREAIAPWVRRAGVVVSPRSTAKWGLLAPSVLTIAWSGDESAPELMRRLAPHVDVLVVPDEEALLPIAAKMLDAAEVWKLPVVTTASWLARDGAAVGVVPDIARHALVLAAHAKRSANGAATSAQPVIRTIDLDAWRRCGRLPAAMELAAADEILNGSVAR